MRRLMTSYTQPNIASKIVKKDISANLYQKCLILCSKILLNMLHNMSLKIWLPWQHPGFQTSPILKASLATFGVPFWYLPVMSHMLSGSCIRGTICKHQNGMPKVVRDAFNIGKVWSLVCCHGNKTVRFVLWSKSSKILLQRIKHF